MNLIKVDTYNSQIKTLVRMAHKLLAVFHPHLNQRPQETTVLSLSFHSERSVEFRFRVLSEEIGEALTGYCKPLTLDLA